MTIELTTEDLRELLIGPKDDREIPYEDEGPLTVCPGCGVAANYRSDWTGAFRCEDCAMLPAIDHWVAQVPNMDLAPNRRAVYLAGQKLRAEGKMPALKGMSRIGMPGWRSMRCVCCGKAEDVKAGPDAIAFQCGECVKQSQMSQEEKADFWRSNEAAATSIWRDRERRASPLSTMTVGPTLDQMLAEQADSMRAWVEKAAAEGSRKTAAPESRSFTADSLARALFATDATIRDLIDRVDDRAGLANFRDADGYYLGRAALFERAWARDEGGRRTWALMVAETIFATVKP